MRHAKLCNVLLATIAATTVPSVARAAASTTGTPRIAPPPVWVRPVVPPAAASAPADEAPIRILLTDQQVAFEPGGRQTVYSATMLAIQTPQGLSAGNISLPWRPETDTLTVHAVRIHRGATVIDVLAAGQTFTVVRRETNLESAMLDGVLTANIQPEGLQVGDRLEVATSLSSSDPTLKGHAELLAAGWNGLPLGRAHLSMQWPAARPLRLRAVGTLPVPKPVRSGAVERIDMQLDDVKPLVLPKGAPARFQIGRLLEATDYAGWADLAALMAPLYRTAATLPAGAALGTEIARIRALSPDPRVRAQAALALVQDRVRYVALAMGAGGLVPATAAETWARRYGDCKGKTALLIALLAALDIPAEPVAVSTTFGDGMDRRLPMVALFDHVLVRATVAGRTYWMDGTRTGDTALDRLTVPAYGWGLPLVATGGALVPMMPPPLAQPADETLIRIDATAGLAVPAPVRVEQVYRGDLAQGARLGVATLSGDARDRALRDWWKRRYDFIDATATTASFDPATGEQRFVLEGKARMDWGSYGYETDGTRIGYKADFSRDPGPDRDAPFAVPHPYSTRVHETILLPPGFETLKAGGKSDVDRTIAGIAYRRTTSLTGNVFTVEKTERSVAPEFPSAEAPAAQAALRTLADEGIYIRKPAGYRDTAAERQQRLSTTPTTAQGFIDRAVLLMDAGRYPEAVADLDRAVAMEPGNVWAHADRAMSHTAIPGHDAAARADLAAAAAIDATNPVVLRVRGVLAQQADDHPAAIAAFTAAIERDPDSVFALDHRARSYQRSGRRDLALVDTARIATLQPANVENRLLRANILNALGRGGETAGEAAALMAVPATDPYPLVAAASIYAALGRDADMMRAYDRALAVKPEAYVYINRSSARDRADFAGRRADLEAALALDKDEPETYVALARLRMDAGDPAGAVAGLTAPLARWPDHDALLVQRGLALTQGGQAAQAEADFVKARAHATTAEALNALCWQKATAGLALPSALAECNAALAKLPGAPDILDSRALVRLRLGQFDAAIADYDAALAGSPDQISSRYGRALARARRGDHAAAQEDAAAAVRAYPNIVRTYRNMGLTL